MFKFFEVKPSEEEKVKDITKEEKVKTYKEKEEPEEIIIKKKEEPKEGKPWKEEKI